MLRAVKPIDALKHPAAERLRRAADEANEYQLVQFLLARDGANVYELAGEIIRDFFGATGAAIQEVLNEYAEEEA